MKEITIKMRENVLNAILNETGIKNNDDFYFPYLIPKVSDFWSNSFEPPTKDVERIIELLNKLIEQYNHLSPLETPDVKVNGALTIGENIGDLGGLAIAYKAYELSLNGAKSPVIDGLTGEQRFFLGWAQCWRQKMRPEEIRRRVATDPHSPDEFRCNQVVRNLEEFHRAFSVKPGDGLYLEESERVRIW